MCVCVSKCHGNESEFDICSFAEDVDVDVSFVVKKINQDKNDDLEMNDLGLSMDQNNNGIKKQEKRHEVVVAKAKNLRRLLTRAKKSSYSSSNPNDFYYYSDFWSIMGQEKGCKKEYYSSLKKYHLKLFNQK